MTINEIRTMLTDNPTREILIEALNAASFIPPLYKAGAYTVVQSMPESEIKVYVALMLKILEYVERKDFTGLKSFLTGARVNPGLVQAIMFYATRFDTIQ